jgi:dipeptidyl aminopeptidase/acylaminoacyl peptidase
MKHFIVLFLMVGTLSCTQVPIEQKTQEEQPDFSNKLTQQEVAGRRLTAEIMWKFGRISSPQVSPDGQILLFSITRYDGKTNKSSTHLYTIPVKGGNITQVTVAAGHQIHGRWVPGTSRIGYLSDESGEMQLWECNADGSSPHQVTRVEGGLNAFEYAPTSGKLWYTHDVQIDKTIKDLYPDLPKANVHIADDLMYRHWDHWEDGAYSHIFVADIHEGLLQNARDIMEGEPYDSPLSPWFDDAEISWSPDGKKVAYTCKKLKGRDYALSTNSDIYLYDLTSGETRNITADNPGYDKYPVWSPDGMKIAYRSMATPGYEADKDRLMIYDMANGEATYMTKDFDQNAGSMVWSPDGKRIYFISGYHATFQYYVLDLPSGSITRLTTGDHNFTSIALAGDKIIGNRMSMSMAPEIFSTDITTGKYTQLSFVNKNIYDKIKMGAVKKRWVATTDDKQELVWVIYPPDFDSTKTYPALLYCQGGPQSAVSQFWSYRWNFQIMAAHDYIIVAPNRRGLPTFGQAWNAEISGDYGGQNMKDYLSAIDALKEEPYIDEHRLGAVGASYGGFSVFWLAGHHEKRFKTFIAHCGIYDFEAMYTSTEETFFVNHDLGGPYWDKSNKVAQRSYATSPHKAAQNWDTPILIITGERDYRIPYTQALEAFGAARLRNIPARLLVFPDESHFVTQPQNAILWQREFFGWLDKWLKI